MFVELRIKQSKDYHSCNLIVAFGLLGSGSTNYVVG